MIKINISEEKMDAIKEKHWEWFKEHFKKVYKKASEINEKNNQNMADLEKILGNISEKFKKTTKDNTENELKKIKDKFDGELLECINEILDSSKLYQKKENARKLKDKIKEYRNNTISKIIGQIFSYEKFSIGSKCWGRHLLITSLDVEVCPYCNRQYITAYTEENSKKTTADLDHFYSKSKYPYLALSLYNFIPSCQICNSRFKLTDDFHENEAIYPFEEEFGDDAKFTIKLQNDKDEQKIDKIAEQLKKENDLNVFTGNSDKFFIDFDIDLNCQNKDKIINSINTFKLRKVYQCHRDYVKELIRKAIVYNESRINELYQEYEGTLFNSREDVIQMIASNYITNDDMNKRVLAKLTKDIIEELGIEF